MALDFYDLSVDTLVKIIDDLSEELSTVKEQYADEIDTNCNLEDTVASKNTLIEILLKENKELRKDNKTLVEKSG